MQSSLDVRIGLVVIVLVPEEVGSDNGLVIGLTSVDLVYNGYDVDQRVIMQVVELGIFVVKRVLPVVS